MKYDLASIMKRAHELRVLHTCTMAWALALAWAEAKGFPLLRPEGYRVDEP